MQKRGQLTLFVIVGIVLLIVFGFLFFAVQSIASSKLKQQAEANLNQIIQSSTLNSFVNQCVEKSLNDGLKLLGVQGGRITREQGGTATADFIPFFRDANQENVSYAVKRDVTICASEPPEYPCPKDDSVCENPNNLGEPSYCAFFYPTAEFYRYSINQLPPLCKSAQDCSYEARSCPTGAATCAARSIQGQLEAYISNKTEECVNLDKIAALNSSVKLSKGNVTTKVTMGELDVAAVVNFPINAQFQGYPQITKIEQFSSKADVRMKQVYQFVDDLIKQNTEKLDFDILSNATDSVYANSQFSITRLKNVRDTDDLYIINDTNRFINSQNFYMQFVVQDRFPALNYIGGSLQKKPIQTDCGDYDVIAIEGQKLQIDPMIFDTDNDPASVEYKGWRQDYNETFNLGNIQIVNGCPVFGTGIRTLATTGRWEDSAIFVDTRISADIMLTKDDVGPHEFIVNVSARGLSDWQKIRILVQDIFSIGGKTKSGYLDVNCADCISLEDPVFLEGDISQIFNPGGYAFRWMDKTNNNIVLGTTNDLALPIVFDVLNIKQQLTTLFPSPNTHVLNITASQNIVEASDEFNVNIFECFPHRNANSDSYPYNTTDGFLSDHTCCSDSGTPGVSGSGWGEILGTSKECFQETNYGYLFGFDLSKYGGQSNPTYKDYGGTVINNPTLTADYGNDIFARKLATHCDGQRGNTCDGPKAETVSDVDECEDLTNFGTGGSARCSGPPTVYLDNPYETSTQPSCTGYIGTTFEQLVNLNSNGLCNTATKCTAGPGTLYSSGSSGNFRCQGTCNNGNCNSATSCVDCRKTGQTCSDSDSGNNLQTQGTVSGNDGTGCSSANCVTQAYSLQDTCANANALTEYNCPSDPNAQDQPYTASLLSCGASLDTVATGDTDDSPGTGTGTCTDGNQASCGTGKCNVVNGGTSHSESCTGSQGNYNYAEWVATDQNEGGSGIKEKCVQTNHDPDDAQAACTSCSSSLKWYASGSSSAFGGYSSGQSTQECCGDDVGEVPSDSPNGNIHRCCPTGTALTNGGVCQ